MGLSVGARCAAGRNSGAVGAWVGDAAIPARAAGKNPSQERATPSDSKGPCARSAARSTSIAASARDRQRTLSRVGSSTTAQSTKDLGLRLRCSTSLGAAIHAGAIHVPHEGRWARLARHPATGPAALAANESVKALTTGSPRERSCVRACKTSTQTQIFGASLGAKIRRSGCLDCGPPAAAVRSRPLARPRHRRPGPCRR